MRVLDLYSGTCSVKKALGDAAIVTSLDNDRKSPAELKVDIMAFDFKAAWQPGEFDAVWASPPCTEYSMMRNTSLRWRPRDFELADGFVDKALEIIRYLQPRAFFIENPSTGLLRTRPMMAGLPSTVVHYCRYGYKHRKPTMIWSNALQHFVPRKCNAVQMCEHAFVSPITGRMIHPESIGAAIPRRSAGVMRVNSHDDRKAVPVELIRELFSSAGLLSLGA